MQNRQSTEYVDLKDRINITKAGRVCQIKIFGGEDDIGQLNVEQPEKGKA